MQRIFVTNKKTGDTYQAEMPDEQAKRWIEEQHKKWGWGNPDDCEIRMDDITAESELMQARKTAAIEASTRIMQLDVDKLPSTVKELREVIRDLIVAFRTF